MQTFRYLLRPFLGIILLILGAVFFIIPIPVGWFVLGISAIFLAPYISFMDRMMTWMEVKDPTKRKVLRRFRHALNRWFPVRQSEAR